MFDLIPSKRNRGLARQDDLVDFYNMVDGFLMTVGRLEVCKMVASSWM